MQLVSGGVRVWGLMHLSANIFVQKYGSYFAVLRDIELDSSKYVKCPSHEAYNTDLKETESKDSRY